MIFDILNEGVSEDDDDIEGRIVIVNEMVPLCTRQNKLRP